MFTLSDLESAHEIVLGRMSATPQYLWPLLSERAGCEVWVKHENHTPIGAFKVRGGFIYMDELAKSGETINGFITATRGNHGQSIPFAARAYDLPVTVIVPEGNSVEKNRAMEAWGANLIVYGHDFQLAREETGRLAQRDSLRMIEPFEVPLVRGVATYALELFKNVLDLDVVYVPIGMGSGICGLITTRDILGLKTEIIGVVSTEADAHARSFEAGRVVETESARTFVDGVATRSPSQEALKIIWKGAARIIRVTDDEVANAMRAYYQDTHNLVEPAGAASYAALMQEKKKMYGKKVGVILTGGNVDTDVFATVLSGETPSV